MDGIEGKAFKKLCNKFTLKKKVKHKFDKHSEISHETKVWFWKKILN